MKRTIFSLLVIMMCTINCSVTRSKNRESTTKSDSVPNDYSTVLSGKMISVTPFEDYDQDAYLLVNNVLITDSIQIKRFHEKYGYDIKKGKYLNQDQALINYRINNKRGLYVYDMKKDIVIILPKNDTETR